MSDFFNQVDPFYLATSGPLACPLTNVSGMLGEHGVKAYPLPSERWRGRREVFMPA